MKYLLLTIAVFTLLAFTWESPVECDDADREISGNRTTPCKLVVPEITSVEYRVREEYPNCIEEMVFHIPGIGLPTEQKIRKISAISARGQGRRGYLYHYNDWGDQTVRYDLRDDYVVIRRAPLGLNSSIKPESGLGNPDRRSGPNIALEFRVRGKRDYKVYSNFLPRPRTDAKLDLVNSCLALLVQEKEDREHAERLKQEEAAKQAELKAQRDAELKAEIQAKREAENQERLAKLELQAVLDNKITAANTELIKTQTLAAQLASEQAIGEVLREIARIKLVGEEDRAKITNDHLTIVGESLSDFDRESAEIDARIREYIAFNELLLTSIAEYRTDIEERTASANALVEEQLEQIGQMQQQAEDLAQEIKALPAPVEEADNANGS